MTKEKLEQLNDEDLLYEYYCAIRESGVDQTQTEIDFIILIDDIIMERFKTLRNK